MRTLLIAYVPYWDGVFTSEIKSVHTLGYDRKRHEYHLMINGCPYREYVPPKNRLTFSRPTYWWKK